MNRILRPRVIVGSLLCFVALYLLLALALVYAATRPERSPFEAVPSDFGLVAEEVEFVPRGGTLGLRGWFFPGSTEAAYLIFVHGIGDQRTGNKALDLAARLKRTGNFNLLLFDLRAQGTSDGAYVSAGEFERFDVLGAYDFLLTRGAKPGRVGLIGRSYGEGSFQSSCRAPASSLTSFTTSIWGTLSLSAM
jgi:pimeloyl-ACP methyl ester carboxylesterase